MALFIAATPAQALNAEGHMLVATIAYDHLSTGVKTRCNQLIAANTNRPPSGYTETFVTGATWADINKSALGTAAWHYIDLGVSVGGYPVPGSYTTPTPNVVTAMNAQVAILQSNATTDAQKAVALLYVIHFVGDMGQPLHCCTGFSSAHTTGDLGGNQFSLTGTYSNLHSMWDAGGGYVNHGISAPLSTSEQNTLGSMSSTLQTTYPYGTFYTSTQGTIPDFNTWATSGKNLASTITYVGVTENTTPGATYTNTAQTTSKQQITTSGYRLADLLNTIFVAYTPVTLSQFEAE